MAPLHTSKLTKLVRTLDDGTQVYEANLDPEWTVASVPYGGYTLSFVLNAAMSAQSNTKQPDPIYVSCQFIRALAVATAEIHVSTVRKGRQFTNLDVTVYQESAKMNTASLIFGNFDKPFTPGLTLPTSHLPLCPLISHPSTVFESAQHPRFNFTSRVRVSDDTSLIASNDKLLEKRDEGGLKWAGWVHLADEDEQLSADVMGVFADMPKVIVSLMPKDHPLRAADMWWLPTLNMSIEFHARIPTQGPFASRTLGVVSNYRRLENGRWNNAIEIWTAPSEFGQNDKYDDWRDKMVCVATGGQIALVAPPEMNNRYAAPKSVPSKL